MVELSAAVLIISFSTLIIIQALGAHLSAYNGSPRAYFLMTTIPGLIVATAVILFMPQVLS